MKLLGLAKSLADTAAASPHLHSATGEQRALAAGLAVLGVKLGAAVERRRGEGLVRLAEDQGRCRGFGASSL